MAQCTLAKLSSAAVAAYRDARLQKVAPATVVRELSLIQTALETATREWAIPLPGNPVARVRRPVVRNERKRRLQPDEEARLLAAAKLGRTGWITPLVMFAIETGMRRSELLALTWSDIDLVSRVAQVRQSKNGEAREVPLSRKSVRIPHELRRHRVECDDIESADGAFVFPFTATAVRLAFERLRSRAGITDLHFHDLRREGITRFIERGLNLIEASAISGHRDLRMLKRYVVPSSPALLRKLDQAERGAGTS